MRTGRSLTVCRSLLPGGGLLWGVSIPGGVYSWGGWGKGVSAPGGMCLLPGGGVCSGEGCVCSWGGGGGGVCSLRVCVCSWGGGICSRGVSAPRGVFAPRGCLLPGGICSWGVSAPGGARVGVCLLAGGVSALGGVCLLLRGVVSQHALRQTPPCEQNDKQVQKYYLGHNFVAAGNNCSVKTYDFSQAQRPKHSFRWRFYV